MQTGPQKRIGIAEPIKSPMPQKIKAPAPKPEKVPAR